MRGKIEKPDAEQARHCHNHNRSPGKRSPGKPFYVTQSD
jgi:hypothetical protein